jgi:putative ABC transport system permease protein
MTALMSESSADPRFRTTLISLFAIAAMVLAAIGLHGVIAFGVARRVREIAIRLALGATTGSVRWRVISQALLLVSGGLAVGLVGAYALGGVLEGMLYETSPADPVALAAVAILLLLTAIVASALPARRATRVQPVDALRES